MEHLARQSYVFALRAPVQVFIEICPIQLKAIQALQ